MLSNMILKFSSEYGSGFDGEGGKVGEKKGLVLFKKLSDTLFRRL